MVQTQDVNVQDSIPKKIDENDVDVQDSIPKKFDKIVVVADFGGMGTKAIASANKRIKI
ncbi:hypothetical protein [Okeania sp. KiyG1]|uniref:hypothetical protein n=1 Tax=Okeania sp. KiyG1 TaxID=2720165 RepID=UPI0019220E36|nr:hypothetical protein [Okeania sp. KiyG1]GGA57261.1 hypothetical protein CYANOKiyG1_78310 [Okeania sp. KiyG1]